MLKPFEYKDLEWVRKERNKDECRKWFRQDHLITELEQKRWYETTDMMSYVVWEKAEGVFEDCTERIGVVSLSHIDKIARKCEFSIMITPQFRGKGYGKKALWELLKIAFNDLNMNQVYSDVFSHNPALDSYLHWGFKAYGTLPNWYYKDGQYVNSVVISITKDEYNNSLQQTISQ